MKQFKYTASVEPVDGKWKITIHTTQHYYVVQRYYNGVKQSSLRTTNFDKAMSDLRVSVMLAEARKHAENLLDNINEGEHS